MAVAFALALPATAAPAPAASLCVAPETPVFSCPLRRKLVSVCVAPGGRAEYRFGLPGRVELRSVDVSLARRMFSGGGETQISTKGANGYAYVVYSRTVRTGFGPDGHNDPRSDSGLLVRRGGRTLATERCGGVGDQPIDESAAPGLATGTYIPH